jgi:hypothetical protein
MIKLRKIIIEIGKKDSLFSVLNSSYLKHVFLLFSIPQNVEAEPLKTKVTVCAPCCA